MTANTAALCVGVVFAVPRPCFEASENFIRMELGNSIPKRDVLALECLRDLFAVGGVLPVIEKLCHKWRLLHADLQKIGDSLGQKVRLDLPT